MKRSTTTIHIPMEKGCLPALFLVPPSCRGAVLFAHGSGSSHQSPRNQAIAELLFEHSFASLLFDLLSPEEVKSDMITRDLRFNIPFLAERLRWVTDWFLGEYPYRPIGYFGSSTGAAAALVAAADRGTTLHALVLRGGRTDLAGQSVQRTHTPTLLVVGEEDHGTLEINEKAFQDLSGIKRLHIVPKASHLFPEPGALDEVCRETVRWFSQFLTLP